MTASSARQLVVVAGHDAYLKGAQKLCALLAQQGPLEVRWFTTATQLVSDQVRLLDLTQPAAWPLLMQADQILAGLGGRDLNRLIHGVKYAAEQAGAGQPRPQIVGYFPGVLHLRIFESLATRLGCDQVLLNCARDYQLYRQLALATRGENNGVLLGAPWMDEAPAPAQPCDIDLLFVEQSVVPHSLADRTQLVQRLIALAQQHPDWRIVVALRARKGEASSHALEHCLEAIYQQLAPAAGLSFVVDDIDALSARARRVATLSSSVAFTTLAWQKPTLFINDLGVQPQWGNDLFTDSGYMAPLHSIASVRFHRSRWCQQFIQLPDATVIAQLYRATAQQPLLAQIPGIARSNLALWRLVLRFCWRYRKAPLAEFSGLYRSIRNINRRIYHLPAGQGIDGN